MTSPAAETSLAGSAGKLFVVWVATITGMEISQWAAVFAIVFSILQIYVLIRDKLFVRRAPREL